MTSGCREICSVNGAHVFDCPNRTVMTHEEWLSAEGIDRNVVKPDTPTAMSKDRLRMAFESVVVARIADALLEAADALPALTEGDDRIGTARWPESDRAAYSIAIQDAQSALRARAERLDGGN